MKMKFAALAASALLAGCSGQTIKEVNRAPAMSPIGAGLNFTQKSELALYPKQPQNMATGYSLWSDQKAALFKDARALKIGDILTVNISIDDEASFANTTDRSRTNEYSQKTDLSVLGLPINSDNSLSSSTNTKGDGSIDRSEKLSLQLAVVVTGVLDNGNLLISGSQEVRVNQELRVLNLAGIARPQDVDADNKISYEKIAEARISYGGRGRLTEVQNPPVGQQLVDIYSPF
ncbi:flagellar basal body L-ring protein FlgH [Rhizobium alvei]|uniref:Flagellar L-ring protein n=1 Tax=Rhizobium alvei TaxID=1132659 RepID=A0ABT8YFU9_9HYPH|nr:flagellar basal body L-ring protein FlgH [Rhizobium alvei]MDO6962565.1 flagellar basal body L-ring protein FlgH [Rhizobium alvei]